MPALYNCLDMYMHTCPVFQAVVLIGHAYMFLNSTGSQNLSFKDGQQLILDDTSIYSHSCLPQDFLYLCCLLLALLVLLSDVISKFM